MKGKKSRSAGLGLGLSICKRICKSLKGNIKVKASKMKVGTIFEFYIECKKDPLGDDSEWSLSQKFSGRSSSKSQAFLA